MKKEEKKKKVIYCWFCGTENDSKRKKCISCGEKLKEKDHPVFVWLFGEIKGEIGDNVLSYICELLSSFFQLHLYGVTIGLAIAFSVVSSVLNFTEPENVEITTNEYALPAEEVVVEEPVEEPKEEETPKEETTTPKPATPKPVTPKPVTPTPKPSTPSTPQETPKELECPKGFTFRSDGKCEIVEVESAWQRHLCPDGFDLVDHKCRKIIPREKEYYCATTVEELRNTFPSHSFPCAPLATYVKGTLNNDKCTYTYYDENYEQVAGCLDFQELNAYIIRKPCPSGMIEDEYNCTLLQDYIIEYYCLEGGAEKTELINGNQCRRTVVLDPVER